MPSESEKPHVRAAPHVVGVPFSFQWNIALPSVYRYENKQWIDEFFATGKLRLSTFAKFATYDDEIRGDTQEGKGIAIGFTDGQTQISAFGQGRNAYVFCASSALDNDLKRAFTRDDVFCIENTSAFSIEVARQLRGFQSGLEGACIYRSDTDIRRNIEVNIEKYRLPNGEIDMRFIQDSAVALGGPERVLLKRKKYQLQQEYRLLWLVDKVTEDHVEVMCPLAIKHCRRVTSADY